MCKSIIAGFLRWQGVRRAIHGLFQWTGIHTVVNQQLRQERQESEKKFQQLQAQIQLLEQKRDALEKEIQVIKAENQHWDEMRSYFLSITSHELRTPLTIIKGAVKLILEEGSKLDHGRMEKYLKMAAKNTEHMIKLLDDLLDLSRLELGYFKLEIGPVDMIRLVRESLEEFRELALERQQDLSSELPDHACGVLGDSRRIKQVIHNLMSNAMKFTPAGGHIRIHLRSKDDVVELMVSDSGTGIDESKRDFIFQQFYQGDGTETRRAEGVGLGLAVVREMVLLHGGKVWFDTQLNQGSTFYVQLPIQGPKDLNGIVFKHSQRDWEPPLVMGK